MAARARVPRHQRLVELSGAGRHPSAAALGRAGAFGGGGADLRRDSVRRGQHRCSRPAVIIRDRASSRRSRWPSFLPAGQPSSDEIVRLPTCRVRAPGRSEVDRRTAATPPVAERLCRARGAGNAVHPCELPGLLGCPLSAICHSQARIPVHAARARFHSAKWRVSDSG